MKKLVSLLMAVSILVGCALPAFATDSVEYSTKGGSWDKVSDDTYTMDKDGDGMSDVTLTQDGNTWNYDFAVGDDTAPYFGWEDVVPDGYDVDGRGTEGNPVYSGNYGELGETVYSHTPNFNDDGTYRSTGYAPNQNKVDVVTVPGAEQLYVRVRYRIYYDYLDISYLAIWDHAVDFESVTDSNKQDAIADLTGSSTKVYLIDGDSVSFGFVSGSDTDDRYGYYADVVGLKSSSEATVCSHTTNMDDEGNLFADYDSNLDVCDVVSVPGADVLKIEYCIGLDYDSGDRFCMWEGDASGYDVYDEAQFKQAIVKDNSSSGWKSRSQDTVYVNGDTLTVGFGTNDVNNHGYGYYLKVVGLFFDETLEPLTSGTTPLDDDGNFAGGYGKGRHDVDVVTIPGATRLVVELTYQVGESYWANDKQDSLFVLAGAVPEVESMLVSNQTSAVSRLDGHIATLRSNTVATTRYVIEGDSVTFALSSGNKDNWYLGYYAKVRAISPVEGSETKYVSNLPLDDSGNCVFGYDANSDDVDVVTCPGADKLLVTLTCQLDPYKVDKVVVWEGAMPEYKPSVDFDSAIVVRTGSLSYCRFLVDGDSVTFGLLSDNGHNEYLGYHACVQPLFLSGDVLDEDIPNGDTTLSIPGVDALCLDVDYFVSWIGAAGDIQNFDFRVWAGSEALDDGSVVFDGSTDKFDMDNGASGYYQGFASGQFLVSSDTVTIRSAGDSYVSDDDLSSGNHVIAYGVSSIGDSVFVSSSSNVDHDEYGAAVWPGGAIQYGSSLDVVSFPGADAIVLDIDYDLHYNALLGAWSGDKSDMELSVESFSDAYRLVDVRYSSQASTISLTFDTDTLTIGFLSNYNPSYTYAQCSGFRISARPVYYYGDTHSRSHNVILDDQGNPVQLEKYSGVELNKREFISRSGALGFWVTGYTDKSVSLSFFQGEKQSLPSSGSFYNCYSHNYVEFFIPGNSFTFFAKVGNSSAACAGYWLNILPVFTSSAVSVVKSDNLQADGTWTGQPNNKSDTIRFKNADAVLCEYSTDCRASNDYFTLRPAASSSSRPEYSELYENGPFHATSEEYFLLRSPDVFVSWRGSVSSAVYGYHLNAIPVNIVGESFSSSENVDIHGGFNTFCGSDVDVVDPVVIPGAVGLKVNVRHSIGYLGGGFCIWEGSHPGFSVGTDSEAAVVYRKSKASDMTTYYVNGDSVTLGFFSHDRFKSMASGDFGYYATIEPIYGTGQKSVSHSSNIDDDGTLLGSGSFSYGSNMDWSEAVRFDGADALRVKVSYDTKSDAYVCVWSGADDSRKPSSDWMTSSTGKLSGSKKTADWIFGTDSVTLGFRSVSAGDRESGYHIQVIPLKRIDGKYVAHSPNVDDEGNRLEPYSPNTNSTSVVSVPGADFMVTRVRYGMNSSNSYVVTGLGAYPDYHAVDDYGKFKYVNRGKSGTTALSSYNRFIEGDSVTYGFHTDGTSVPSGNGGYGYYVDVEPYSYLECGPRFYHSANVDDDNQIVSGYGDNRNDVDTITFVGASQLLVTVKSQVVDTGDYVNVYDRAITEDEFVNGTVSRVAQVCSTKGMGSQTLLIDSDTVSFGFRSGASGSNAYGYYAEVYPVWEPGSVGGKSDMTITNKKRETVFVKGNILLTKLIANGPVTKTSHMSNLDDDGNVLSSTYKNNESFTDVVTIPGATKLGVDITYQTESTSYDWACVWAGNHPEYTAYSNYGSSVSGKLGGTTKKTVHYDVEGDSVTFGFRSDGSGNGYYGYHAVVTSEGAGGKSRYGFDVTLSTELDGLEKYITGKQEFGDVVFYDGKAFVYAVPGEPVSIKGVPEGVEWSITERLSEGTESVSWQLGDMTIDGDTVSGVVVGDVTANAVCLNTVEAGDSGTPRLDLTVDKSGDVPADEEFDFTLKLWGLEPERSYVTSADGSISSDSLGIGLASFKLATGQSFVVRGLPAGCSYDVEEAANGCISSYAIEGWSGSGFKSDENSVPGMALSTGKRTTAEGDAPVVTFTNRAPVETIPETVDVTVRKTWVGGGDKPDSIGFDLFEGNDLVGSGILDEDSGWTTTFRSLPKFRGDGTTPCEYGIREATVPGFESSVSKVSDVEFEITNSHTDTGNLRVSKTVDGYDGITGGLRDTKFVFDIAAYEPDGSAVYGEYVTSGSVEGTVEFEEGHASVQIGHGESVTIEGLPAGAHCIVTEQDDENFVAVDGAVRDGDITADGELELAYTNRLSEKGEADMPETGGPGIQYYIIGGVFMLAFGLSLLRKKKPGNAVGLFVVALFATCFLGMGMDVHAAEPVIVETFNISLESGAILTNGNYVWAPTEPSKDHKFVYRLDYSLSGMFSSEPGALRFELPMHIFKNRDGRWADTFECAYRHEAEIGNDDSPDFAYRFENGKVVIYNYSAYETGTSGYIEFAYVTSEPTFEYVDMSSSISVDGKLTVTNLGETVIATASGGPVTVDTGAELKSVGKYTPKFYEDWISSWGEKPDDADQWLYLIWPVCASFSKATQPYDLSLEDAFSDMGGSVVGYRFSDRGTFMSDGTIIGSRKYGSLWAYVLTRHSKAEVETALSSANNYAVDNVVRATVTPCDKIDAPSRKQGTATWVYQVPAYEAPDGHFWAEKYGIYNTRDRVKSSEDVSNFYLAEFQSGDIDALGYLKFEAYVKGHPYPWTLGEGADGTINDALNGLYGQKEVTYSLTDDSFTIGDIGYNGFCAYLEDGDYDMRRILFYPTMLSAKFDPDTMKFVEQPAHWGSYDKSDNPVFEFRVGKDEWVKGFEFDMNTFYLLDMNEKYITGYGGAEVDLAKGVKGVRVRCSNAYWYTNMSLTPVIDIYRTDHVLGYLGDGLSGTTVPVTNHAHAEVTQDGEVLFERDVYGTDYIKKATRTSEIQKSVTATHNDRVGRVVHVTWRSSVRESVVDISGKGSVYQKSGMFYELLPKGALLQPDTVSVEASGKEIPETQYAVELIPNYKDSGRTMMKIDIKTGTEDAYVVRYTTAHTWASVKDYGKRLLSSVAYESGNMSLAGGSKDNGGKLEDRVIMADVSDNDRDVFLYADARHTLDVLTAGSTGLMKQVSSGDGTCFTYESSVGLNDMYTYRVRYENDATTASRDIMFFDSIENFFQRETDEVPTMESDWKGVLQSIDLSQLRSRGVKPVVYLSGVENLNPYDHHDVDDKSTWAEYGEFVEKYGLDAAKAICVDARKGLNGSDFVLGKGNSLSFDIVLRAPSEAAGVDDKAYNNIFASMSIIKDTSEGLIPKFFHQDYTSLGLRVTGDLVFDKVDALDVNAGIAGAEFLLSGTSEYGNLVNLTATSDVDGSVIFKDVELGTYELIETDCSPDWQLGHDTHIVKVGLSGDCDVEDAERNRDGTQCIPNEARVHGDVVFYKADGVSGRLLNCATFRLAGTSDYGNEVLETATSVLGCVSFGNIEMGSYKLAEVTPADGYIPSKATWDVRVNSMGVAEFPDGLDTNDLGRPVIKNEKYHSVRFVKTSTYGENVYLGGAEFEVYGTSDYGHDIRLTATSSDAADGGLVVFTGLEPGTYILKETKAPEDHGLNEQEYVVNVHADDSYEIIGLNKISFGAGEVYEMKDPKTKGTVRVTKKWDDDLLNVDRPIPDITISTKRLVKDAVNYSVRFNANGGLFADDSRELTATYMRNGKFVSGEITDPYVENAEYATFKGWYTQETGGKQVMVSADGDLDMYVADGLTLYARYVFKPRYAVSVWGIGRDTDADGNAMGLTFGPALRVDTSGSYKQHAPEGTTAEGNGHRCVHRDTWETIIEWNRKDPYVYEQCIANNCSKALEVDTSVIGGSLEPTLSAGYGSDGGSVLAIPGTGYSSTNVASDWGRSLIRAMLNGPDILTASNNRGDYSDTRNLYAGFSEALRNAMGRAAVKYDPAGSGNTEEGTLVSYDFLWIPSVNDMCGMVLDSQGKVSADNHPFEGTAYDKFADVKDVAPGNSTNKWFCVSSGGAASGFPMRSLSGTGTKFMRYGTSGLENVSLTTKQTTIAPCFSLKR